jgi:hypothetical protein
MRLTGPSGEYYLQVQNGKAWWGGLTTETLQAINSFKSGLKFVDFEDDDAYFLRYT